MQARTRLQCNKEATTQSMSGLKPRAPIRTARAHTNTHTHTPGLVGHKCAALALALGCAQHHQLQDVAHGAEDGPQVSLCGLKGHLADKQLPAGSVDMRGNHQA
eukprot:1159725-Pelagomonas_calceolata.AAC.16